MENSFQYNANDVVRYLNKPTAEFTKADIVRFICENGIRMINFLYPAGDGRLKTLNFVITDMDYLDTILTCGERVDGSSLFKLQALTFMYCRVSLRLSLILLLRFLRLLCFAASSMLKVILWQVVRSRHSRKQQLLLQRLQALSSKQWASWNTM